MFSDFVFICIYNVLVHFEDAHFTMKRITSVTYFSMFGVTFQFDYAIS